MRRYEEGDFDAIVKMYEDLDPSSRSMGLPPRTQDGLERWLTELTEEGWNLVAIDGDRVVGHVGVAPATTADPQFVIFVHDDYQNRGIGAELIKHVVAYAADQGHTALRLDVAKENCRAIAVYRNVEFEITKEKATKLSMCLSLNDPIAEYVQRPPAER